MPTLTATLTQDDGGLVVEYRVRNDGSGPLFVAAVPLDATGKPYPESAYCALSADDQRLELVVGASPMPTHKMVEFQVIALSVKVPPGEEHVGAVRLAKPVKEWHAYALPVYPPDTATPASAYQVAFSVDVVRDTEVGAAVPTDDPALWRAGGGQVVRLRQVLTPDQSVPVLRRGGPFARGR